MTLRKLIISPQAGFGNRLRALCAAKVFGTLLGRKVFHYWVKDDERSHVSHVNDMKDIDPSYMFELNIPLFDGESADACFTEWMPGDFWYREQSTAQKRLRCGNTIRLTGAYQIAKCQYDTVLVETSHALQVSGNIEFWNAMMTDVYRKYFILNARWTKIYDNLPSFDYGISIRRSNFLTYNPEAGVEAELIASKINKYKGSKVIFSDDKTYQNELRIIASSPFGINDTESGLYGIDNYICQFLVLSKCKCILGTSKSSFPEQASVFGGTFYEPI